MTRIYLMALVAMSLGLSACGSTPQREETVVDTTQQRSSVVQPVTIDGVQDGTEIDPNSIAGRAPLERVIYFDYDRAELRPEFLDIVTQHGRFSDAWAKNRRVNVIYEVAIQN